MKHLYTHFFGFFALSTILATGLMLSCKNENSPVSENTKESKDQHFVKEKIKTAAMAIETIEQTVEANGTVAAPPQSVAEVSAPINGFVTRVYSMAGKYVQKGDVLVALDHPDYLKMQQQFLESLSSYKYHKEEFTRQGQLNIEHATSMKTMQQAEKEYLTAESALLSLKKQLEWLGIDTDTLNTDNISAQFYLRAPISGYITQLHAPIGKYISENTVLFTVVNTKNLHLHLMVNQQYASTVKPGNTILFWEAGNAQAKHKATVFAVNKKVNESTGQVTVYAQIQNPDKGLLPGMFVRGILKTNQTEVMALPTTAVFQEDGKSYAFIHEGQGKYRRQQLETGVDNGQYIEILHIPDSLLNKAFVTQGTYYVRATENE